MQRLEKGMGSPQPELIAAVAPEQPEEYIEPELEEEIEEEIEEPEISFISGESIPSIASFRSLIASYIIEYDLISICSFSDNFLAL